MVRAVGARCYRNTIPINEAGRESCKLSRLWCLKSKLGSINISRLRRECNRDRCILPVSLPHSPLLSHNQSRFHCERELPRVPVLIDNVCQLVSHFLMHIFRN